MPKRYEVRAAPGAHNSFWRSGRQFFQSVPTILSEDELTDAIQAERMLVVTPIEDGPSALDEMTIAELTAYAGENGIDLGDARKKADILEAIQAVEADSARNQDDGDESETTD